MDKTYAETMGQPALIEETLTEQKWCCFDCGYGHTHLQVYDQGEGQLIALCSNCQHDRILIAEEPAKRNQL